MVVRCGVRRDPSSVFAAALLSLCTMAACTSCPTARRFRGEGEVNPTNGQPFPHTLLYSFEGSGNTWTRWLFENSTGAWGWREQLGQQGPAGIFGCRSEVVRVALRRLLLPPR